MTPSDGNTRTLTFPNGGTMQIPLPGSKARFEMRPGSVLSNAPTCPARTSLIIGLVLGVAVGVGAAAWWMSRR